MTDNNNGGMPDPNSEAGKALAELAKEGHTIEGKEETPTPDPVVPAKVEEKKEPVTPAEDPKKPEPEQPKPNRPITMVEAYKLKITQDQKDKLEKELNDLKAKYENGGKPAPTTQPQKDDLKEAIKAIAEENGVDANFLEKFADTIIKKVQPSGEVVETVKKLNEEREVQHQESLYTQEFDKDVVPLVKAQFPTLSDTALSEIKEKLKGLAFTETYAKVPLSKIFLAEQGSLDIQVPKKSSEGKGVKTRSSDIVDLDNLTEEDLKNLPSEKVEELSRSKGSGSGWNTNRK